MKILLAVDGSPFTKKMLTYVTAHDDWLGAGHQYTVVQVAPNLVMGSVATRVVAGCRVPVLLVR